ncbi:hypothetical protein E8E11_004397 [Didymella keratinophila]|nr:hypothetical protein E8E11_004397 [Didymella keratinophila]
MINLQQCLIALASAGTALAASSYATLEVRNAGVPAGESKSISGIEIYHSYPPNSNTSEKAIIHLTDIFGLPLLQNKLLADSIASNGYLVLVPDLFAGDPVGVEEQEAGLNLTEWRALHPQSAIEAVIDSTIQYARIELGIEKLGGVGYCFGGKYVGRWLKGDDSGLDVGFVAHPSNLLETEIQAIAGPLSIAAGNQPVLASPARIRNLPLTPDRGSDADSFDLAPDSPLNREKTRTAHASWVLELEQKPEFRLLQIFSHQSQVMLEDAIHQLVDLTHKAALEEEIGNHCWVTACCFLELAARTAPEQQNRLVELLLSLRSIILTDSSTDAPLAFEDGEGVIWQDLPTFGYTIADEMGSFDGQEQDYTQEEARKWENLTAFLAQVDAQISESPSPLDFSQSWALTAFAWAFEGNGRPSELAIRLACIWLVYDVDKLWSKVWTPQAEPNAYARWLSWRQGLEESQSRFGYGTTPELIARALNLMIRAQANVA